MSWQIRRARAADMASFAEIVNEHIRSGVAHFGDQAQAAGDWQADWEPLRDRYPWLVAERDGRVDAIAYAKPFNPRAAYDWTSETTIYVRDGRQGQGIGSALYGRLLNLLDAQGYRCLIAGITLPNDASVALHESLGFEYLGTLEQVGYKLGSWHDVGSWQRHTGSRDDAPGPILAVDAIDT